MMMSLIAHAEMMWSLDFKRFLFSHRQVNWLRFHNAPVKTKIHTKNYIFSHAIGFDVLANVAEGDELSPSIDVALFTRHL